MSRINFFGKFPSFRRRETYEPWYNEKSDYNTNAKSYYDYLARFNRLIKTMIEKINRALNRNIEIKDTNTIDFTKIGDWIDNGLCEPNNYDDIITLLADVKVSSATTNKYMTNLFLEVFELENAILIFDDGLYVPDYWAILERLDILIHNIIDKIEDLEVLIQNVINRIEELEVLIQNVINRIENIEVKVETYGDALQKIINNLYESGAITNNNINNFEFKPNRNIATGNINFFGGVGDGDSFIRTNDGATENDVSAGW